MKRIDLLPPEARAKASRERGLLYAILILVAVVVVLGLVYMQQNSSVSTKQAEVDRIAAETLQVQADAARLAPYANIDSTRKAMTQTAQSIYEAGVSWSTILQEISLVIPDNVRLQSLNCTVPPVMIPGAPAAAVGVVPAVTTDITFIGTTYTHKDVAEFMTRLGLMPQLTNIQLGSSTRVPGTAATADSAAVAATVNFTVTASLRPYLTAPPTTALLAAGATQ
jgi:Tfp pilus assembly protein PilN